ncbi:MAG: hypothetical protein QXX01_00040 [Candidatus Aenigmatarchaeota archaeon]
MTSFLERILKRKKKEKDLVDIPPYEESKKDSSEKLKIWMPPLDSSKEDLVDIPPYKKSEKLKIWMPPLDSSKEDLVDIPPYEESKKDSSEELIIWMPPLSERKHISFDLTDTVLELHFPSSKKEINESHYKTFQVNPINYFCLGETDEFGKPISQYEIILHLLSYPLETAHRRIVDIRKNNDNNEKYFYFIGNKQIFLKKYDNFLKGEVHSFVKDVVFIDDIIKYFEENEGKSIKEYINDSPYSYDVRPGFDAFLLKYLKKEKDNQSTLSVCHTHPQSFGTRLSNLDIDAFESELRYNKILGVCDFYGKNYAFYPIPSTLRGEISLQRETVYLDNFHNPITVYDKIIEIQL